MHRAHPADAQTNLAVFIHATPTERCNFRGKLIPDATAKEIMISRQGSHLKPLLMGTIAFAHRGHIIARLL
jgi:hypothetical protein